MKKEFRSGCPISSTLDIVGDKWSLLIIRDMLIKHKKTFKEIGTLDPKSDKIPSEKAMSVAEGIAQPFIVSELPQFIKT